MDVNEAVDASKENIQPLKEGRKATQLSTALLAQTNSEKHQALLKERYQFEIQIRSYEGDDPLQPWYDYINWTEQSFPKHGREGNLQLILEKCLSEFKDVQQYTQDLRYIKLWIKFIDMATNPLELYQHMYGCNIGTECSLFYYNWAEEFAKNEDFKRADQVYVEGIKRNAQPIDDLINAHNNFQLAVARHVLSGGALFQETSNSSSEQRLALSRLKPHGKNAAVTSLRTGSNLQRSTPGVLQPLDNAPLPGGKKIDKKKNVGIHIYSDENGSAGVLAEPVSKPTAVVPKRDQLIKENAKKTERWNEVKLKHKVKPVNQPAFEVHVDENAATGSVNQVNNANIHVLKPRKLDEHISCPIALFESPNPKRRPMYAKHKVYTGGMEFSIEELRAIVYNKRYEEQKAKEKEAKEVQEIESRLSKACTVSSDSICEDNIQHVIHGHSKSNIWLAKTAHSSRDVSSSTLLHEEVVYNKDINLPITQLLVPEVADPSSKELRECLISKEAQISPFSDEQLHQNNYSNNSDPFELNSCQTDFQNNVRSTSHCNKPSKVFEHKCVSETQEQPENVSPSVLTRIEESKALHSDSSTQERTSQSEQSNRTPSFELYVDDEEEMEKKIRNAAIKKKPETKLEIIKQPGLIMQRCTDPVGESFRIGLKRPRKMHTVHELSTIQADVSEREPSNHLESNSVNAVEQSFTVNTKAAMNLMQDLWKTPEARRTQPAQLLSNQNIPKFTIHMDDSVVQKESEFSKNVAENKHCVVPNTVVAPFKVLSDPREREMGNSAQVNVYLPPRDVYSEELPHKMYSEIPHMKNQIPIKEASSNDYSEDRQRLLPNVNLTNPSRIPFQVVTPLQQRKEVEATGHEGQCDRVPVVGQRFDLLSATETEAGAVPHGIAGIPFVPSPGMTPAELDELQDLGDKENAFSSVKKVKEGGHRMFAGILQPSQQVPFIPLEEQEQHVPEEEEDNLGVGYLNEFPMSNETCTTQAFSYPLPSSTPFIGHFRNSRPHDPEIQNYEGSFIVHERVPKKQDDVPQAVAPYSLSTQTQESISAVQQRETSRKCSFVPNLQLPRVFATEFKKPNDREFSQGPSESSSSVIQNVHATVKENVPLTVNKENLSSHQHMAKSHTTDSSLTVQCSARADSLSIILETSKEYKSSSSSGSCSTTTSHRTTSHWAGALSVGNLATITENSFTYEQRSGYNNEHLEKGLPVHEAVDQISKSEENVVKGVSELKIDQDLDPFLPAFTDKLLSTLGFPLERHIHHLAQVDAAIPRFKTSCSFTLGDDDYVCNGTVGEGAYAKVIKAKRIPSGRVVALKIQKPACWWEYYIAEELRIRLNDPTLALRFMSVDMAYFLNNGSVMVIEFSQHGSLISVINTYKERASKNVPQMVTIHWTWEMLLIMEHLHKCGIIHADIKPDNFIVRKLPESSSQEPSLQLIDFGRAIDMTLLPPGTTFSVVDKTKCFQCIEMKMNEPWTYQIDIFRMAGTVHCILFGDYMKVDKKGDKWFICKSIPRYYDQALWRLFFTELLNIRSCNMLPNLSEVKLAMQQKLESNTNSDLRDFKAVVGDS